MAKTPVAILLATLFLVGPVQAGGDIYPYKGAYAPQGYCSFVEYADELASYQNIRSLRDEVKGRYEHAAEVANSKQAIYSQSPLFVWASEAKVSCAKSYGYLRKARKWRKRPDYVTLQKCECFYERMLAYLGRRY